MIGIKIRAEMSGFLAAEIQYFRIPRPGLGRGERLQRMFAINFRLWYSRQKNLRLAQYLSSCHTFFREQL